MIEVRACSSADAPAVGALLGELGYEASAGAVAERMQQLNSTGSDPMFLAHQRSQALGLIALHRCWMIQYDKPVMRITALVVDHRSRRCGVGSLLIEHAQRWANQAGCGLVELTSALDRTEAHTFYRKLGFEPNSLRFRKPLTGR
jgi:GNAT superfamily N-acetyltransferase